MHDVLWCSSNDLGARRNCCQNALCRQMCDSRLRVGRAHDDLPAVYRQPFKCTRSRGKMLSRLDMLMSDC